MAVEDQLERLMSIQISNIGLENSQSVRCRALRLDDALCELVT